MMASKISKLTLKDVQLSFRGCKFRYGEGAKVKSLTTHYESLLLRTINIENVSSKLSDEALDSILTPYHCQAFAREPEERLVTARFDSSETALEALTTFDGKVIRKHRLKASWDHGGDSFWIQDGLLVEWDTCHTSAILEYNHQEDANLALELNGSAFQQKKVAISKMPGKPNNVLLVENLPSNVDPDDLILFAFANNATVIREYHSGIEGYDSSFDALSEFLRGQPGCSTLSLELLPTAKEKGAAWISTSSQSRQEDLLSRLAGIRPPCLEGCPLAVQPAQAAIWRLTSSQFSSLDLPLMDIGPPYAIAIPDPENERTFLMQVVDANLWMHAKHLREIRTECEGVIWTELDQSTPVWDGWFVTDDGRAFLGAIAVDHSVSILCDGFARTIRICGLSDRLPSTFAALDLWPEQAKNEPQTLRTAPAVLKKFAKLSLDKLRAELSDIRVDPEQLTVTFTGTREHRRQVTLELYHIRAMFIQKKYPAHMECPVCMTPATQPIALACNHVYCLDCIVHLLTSLSVFPARCVCEGCQLIIALELMEQLLSNGQCRKVLNRSAEVYIAENASKYKRCPSLGCEELFRVAPNEALYSPFHVLPLAKNQLNRTIQCPTCFIQICASCYDKSHPHVTCHEQRRAVTMHQAEREFSQWKERSGAKPCPVCARVIEKADGCAHVICPPPCGAHYCWECLKVYPSDSGRRIYDHIRRRHMLFEDRQVLDMVDQVIQMGI